MRKSNPRLNLGKVPFYHYTNIAQKITSRTSLAYGGGFSGPLWESRPDPDELSDVWLAVSQPFGLTLPD